MKVYELLSSPERWTIFATARDIDGETLGANGANSPRAVCWCLYGAISKCYHNVAERKEIVDCISETINKRFNTHLIGWNDCVATYDDVINLCKELDV